MPLSWLRRTPKTPAPGAKSASGGASEDDDDDLPPALRRRMAVPKKRVLAREVIAARVVEAIRHAKKSHVYLPADLDEAVEWWCAKHKVVRPSTDLMRELIKRVPGVDFVRARLKQRPDLEHIREQLREADKPDDRAWIYTIASVQALAEREADAVADAARARSKSAHAPPPERSGRTRGGPAPGKDPDSLTRFRKKASPDNDAIVIGHATPGASDAPSASAPARASRRAA
jgi:hypothetical protein